jgi:hypothetical protein
VTERISTWAEVAEHLAATVEVRARDDRRLEIAVDGTALEVGRIEVDEAPWIEVVGVMGPGRYVSLVQSLVGNATTAIGACGLRDGALAMRQTLPLDGLRRADLDETVRALAFQCAWARKQLTGG